MSESLTHKGHNFTVEIDRDTDMGHPWHEHDGHGYVNESSTRHAAREGNKRPLNQPDRGQYQFYYDMKASTDRARRDGWGLSDDDLTQLTANLGKSPTKSQIVAQAVENDFQFMRKYLAGDVCWWVVTVTHDDSGQSESVGGVLCEDGEQYLDDVARELAEHIVHTIETRERDLQLAYEGL
jgi:hypothetical protein